MNSDYSGNPFKFVTIRAQKIDNLKTRVIHSLESKEKLTLRCTFCPTCQTARRVPVESPIERAGIPSRHRRT